MTNLFYDLEKVISKDVIDQYANTNPDYADPSGFNPSINYEGKPNVNKLARGEGDEVHVGGSVADLDLELPPVGGAEYPYSQVKETKSGHIIEYDDTPGNERIMIKHRTGSGVEMRVDGTMVYSSVKNSVKVTTEDEKVIVDGDAEMHYNGNLRLKVAGAFDLEVGGNYNVKVDGDVEQKIKGGYQKDVAGNIENTVTGDKSETIVGHNTQMVLQGNNNIIKGNHSLNVGGHMNHHVGDTLIMTAEHEVTLSTLSANVSASSLLVQGDSGTIGGSNIVYYGHTAHIPRVNSTSVHATAMYATTFHGDLTGKADSANHADFATTAGEAPNGNAGEPGENVNNTTTAADSSTIEPTTSILNATLNASPFGIRRVTVDEQDFIKNAIDRSVNYGGVSKTNLDTREARSKLRDPNNINNETFVGAILSEGIISAEFASIAPKEIGRTITAEKTIQRGDASIGTQDGTSELFT